jgi:hypothetical protein
MFLIGMNKSIYYLLKYLSYKSFVNIVVLSPVPYKKLFNSKYYLEGLFKYVSIEYLSYD